MWQDDLYVREKLREIEGRKAHAAISERTEIGACRRERRPRPSIGGVVRVAGRRVRRLGEALESWGAPAQAEG